MVRRLIAAALLLLAVAAPALAQSPYPPGPPPPVPGLPDAQRQTTYTISGTTCACAVGFQLYGDSTDYQSWVEVWVNGVNRPYSDSTYGWTITSPTGSLATIPRPITDGVLTFNNPITGTVIIVGAQRPRRTAEFAENQGVTARALNQWFNTVVAELREVWDKINDVSGRTLLGQPGNAYGPLPQPAQCAGAFLGFDGTGLNPLCQSVSSTGTATFPNSSVDGDFAVFNGTSGKSFRDLPALTVFCNDQPFANLKCFGAVADNSTDNHNAFVNAYLALSPYGGTMFVPPGFTYCIKSSIDLNSYPVHVLMGGMRSAYISACGAASTPLILDYALSSIDHGDIFGQGWNGDTGTCCSTTPAFKLGAGCVFCAVTDMEIQGGSGVLINGSDSLFERDTANNSYGTAVWYIGCNGCGSIGEWFVRVAGDNSWPISNPTPPFTVGTWAPVSSETAGQTYACSGFIYQVKTNGTSGSTCPTPKNYGIDITDGSAVLRLAGPTVQYSYQLDSNAFENQFTMIDASCFQCTAGVGLTNSLSQNPPGFTAISQSVFLGTSNGVIAGVGSNLAITQSHGSCESTNCPILQFNGSWAGSALISSNFFFNAPNGINDGAGNGLVVNGNEFHSLTGTAISVGANINGVSVSSNLFGSGAGSVLNGVNITTGTGTHISVVGNICANVTGTCVSNGASGTTYVPAGGNP